MGMFKSLFNEAKKHGESVIKEKLAKLEPPPAKRENPPTRWEKAVLTMNGIVSQVASIDPDGVDVVCFGGKDDSSVNWYRNIKNLKGLEEAVTETQPGGDCHMGSAMSEVINEAFERGFEERPCSILVLTAGRPDDHDELDKCIKEAAEKMNKSGDLTITFVQVGDDEDATTYLKHLDDNLTTTHSDSGETIDIVDTIKDEEIQKAVGEVKKEGFLGGGGGGALFGAFAGAALGVGGVYLHNKMNAKKRTEGWNGKWTVYSPDADNSVENTVITVTDDMEGTLTIDDWADEKGSTGQYVDGGEDGGGYLIQHTPPGSDEPVVGTVEDEHNILWSDGSRWEECKPDGAHWSHYAGAAAAGGAGGGAAGALMQKKFFNKASHGTKSDYVIVLDRSKSMAVADHGK